MVPGTRFHIRFIMTIYYEMWPILLQNRAAILYKIRQKFITKYVRFFITKCDSYYKMRQLLRNATFITNCNSTSTYKTCSSKKVINTQLKLSSGFNTWLICFCTKNGLVTAFSKINAQALKKSFADPFFLLTLNRYLAKKSLLGFTRLMFLFAVKAISLLIKFYLHCISFI